MDATTRAATNRAIRNIKTELEFLQDHNLVTSQQFTAIEALLPRPNSNHTATPIPSNITPPSNLASAPSHTPQPPPNEKADHSYYQPTPSPGPPPPAYGAAPVPPILASAVALYAYQPSDAGDLALSANDRVQVSEYMNADWAKGRNERTGLDGIFPRSYVRVEKEHQKGAVPPPPSANGYPSLGGMLATGDPVQAQAQQQQQQPGQPPAQSKFSEHGKKFGKKLGNAATFGAGATIGSNIVNSIF